MSILAISNLFGRSPFAALQVHMEKVAHCIERLNELFPALYKGDFARVKEYAEEISKLEHAADLTKKDLRGHLPKGLFMPVDRASLLDILAIQDSIADKAEDIAVLLTLRDVEIPERLRDLFPPFLTKNCEAFEAVREVIQELHELLESSFGGIEADKVRDMIDGVAKKEHQVDLLQRELLSELFQLDDLPTPVFQLWLRVLSEIAEISNLSERLANRILLTLETK